MRSGDFVEGAGEDDAPEAIDGAGRLAVPAEPVAEGRVGVGGGESEAGQAPGDAGLVGEAEVMGAEEGAGEVQGSGQTVGGEGADAAVGRHEEEAALGSEEMIDADGPAEVGEVGAAAHADVLAGVEELAGGGVGEGAGPAAEPAAQFEEGDGEPRCGRAAAAASPASPRR